MAPIGNRYLMGQPILPYASYQSYAGVDAFFDLAFQDHAGVLLSPTTLKLEVNDLTNSQTMLGPTILSGGGSAVAPLIYGAFASTMVLQVSASIMQMTYPYQGSQICQFKFTFTGTDSVTGATFTSVAIEIVELCAAATVSGS